MKIGVLTYFCVPNFGAQLQSLSTIGALKRRGHNPILLNWYPRDLEDVYRFHVSKAQRDCQMQFAKEHYPLSKLCRREDDLVKVIDDGQFDMIITGSDALFRYVPKSKRTRAFSWRKLRYVNSYTSCEDTKENPFFCTYYDKLNKKIPVVAFSVSSQSSPYFLMTEEERTRMKKCMQYFRHISVRDEWTRKMVCEIMGVKDVDITPDPVFAFNENNTFPLLSKEELQKRYGLPEDYILVSFPVGAIAPEYIRRIAEALKQKGLTLVALPEPEGLNDFGLPDEIQLPLDPLSWYSLLINSRGYIGSRMHPIVVCLHNAVPFFSFDGNGTIDASGVFNAASSKTYDILSRADLLDHTFVMNSGLQLPKVNEVVDKLLSFDRNKCKAFSEEIQKRYDREMD